MVFELNGFQVCWLPYDVSLGLCTNNNFLFNFFNFLPWWFSVSNFQCLCSVSQKEDKILWIYPKYINVKFTYDHLAFINLRTIHSKGFYCSIQIVSNIQYFLVKLSMHVKLRLDLEVNVKHHVLCCKQDEYHKSFQ